MVEKVELKEIINQIRGVSYGKNDVSDTKVDGYVPVLRSNNIQDSRIDLSDLVYVKPEKVKPVQFLKKGDILITASTGSLKVIGKNAQCKDDLNASFGAFCKVVRVKDADHSYLGHLFQSPQYFSYIQNIVNGANINNIKNEHIDNFKIPLPPLKTQQKIAQILDNAAALRDKTAQLIEEYNLLAQSIFLEMFGDPVVNPMGWDTKTLKELTSKIGSGATPKGGKESYKEEGISLIRSLNIHDNIFKMKDLAFIDDAQANKLKNVIIEENDVLLNITGASVARCAIVPSEILPARVNQHVSILRTKRETLNPIFLLHLIISPNTKVKLLGVGANNGATREAINKEQLENFEIPVPPIKLQTHFAQKIANIEVQKALARQELKESQDLFNCLLQKAFKGEL